MKNGYSYFVFVEFDFCFHYSHTCFIFDEFDLIFH